MNELLKEKNNLYEQLLRSRDAQLANIREIERAIHQTEGAILVLKEIIEKESNQTKEGE